MLTGAGGSLRRQYGADGRPLSRTQRRDLQRWQDDFGALASSAAQGDSLQSVLELPALAQQVSGGSTRWPPSAATNASLALLGAAMGAAMGAQHGAALRQLSAVHHDNWPAPAGADNLVLGGYSRVPQYLAAWLGLDLRLRTPVATIRHSDSGATVVAAGGQMYRSQYVVCTVPLGVLRTGGVQLDPPLPPATQAAMARLGVGTLEVLWLAFDTVWWEVDGPCVTGEAAAPCEQLELLGAAAGGGWRRFISLAAHTPQRPIVGAVAAAEAAERWGDRSDAQLAESAMAALRRVFPSAPSPRAMLASRWGQDPWARGSTSYYAVDSADSAGPGDRATLAEPQSGSLLLAGEATWAPHPSTVHGALLSGREAALRVLAAAAELPQCGSAGGSGSGSGSGTCVAPPPGGTPSLRCECDALPPTGVL